LWIIGWTPWVQVAQAVVSSLQTSDVFLLSFLGLGKYAFLYLLLFTAAAGLNF
jgi:hypothetical protein